MLKNYNRKNMELPCFWECFACLQSYIIVVSTRFELTQESYTITNRYIHIHTYIQKPIINVRFVVDNYSVINNNNISTPIENISWWPLNI